MKLSDKIRGIGKKLPGKVTWLAAVSLLAIGIPLASMASPYEMQTQPTPVAQPQQTQATVDVTSATPSSSQNSAIQQAAQQNTAAQQSTTTQQNTAAQQSSAVPTPVQPKATNTTSAGYHNGHTGMNDGYHNSGYHPGHNGMNDGYHNTEHGNAPAASASQNTVNTNQQGQHYGHTGMNDGYHGNMGMEHGQQGMGGHE